MYGTPANLSSDNNREPAVGGRRHADSVILRREKNYSAVASPSKLKGDAVSNRISFGAAYIQCSADCSSTLFLHSIYPQLLFPWLFFSKAAYNNINKLHFKVGRDQKSTALDFHLIHYQKSDETLCARSYSLNRAHEICGENLRKSLKNSLPERELILVFPAWCAVVYIIAQKLVWRSNEDGFTSWVPAVRSVRPLLRRWRGSR